MPIGFFPVTPLKIVLISSTSRNPWQLSIRQILNFHSKHIRRQINSGMEKRGKFVLISTMREFFFFFLATRLRGFCFHLASGASDESASGVGRWGLARSLAFGFVPEGVGRSWGQSCPEGQSSSSTPNRFIPDLRHSHDGTGRGLSFTCCHKNWKRATVWNIIACCKICNFPLRIDSTCFRCRIPLCTWSFTIHPPKFRTSAKHREGILNTFDFKSRRSNSETALLCDKACNNAYLLFFYSSIILLFIIFI